MVKHGRSNRRQTFSWLRQRVLKLQRQFARSKKLRNLVCISGIILLSVIAGWLTDDLLIGAPTLATGALAMYLAGNGSRNAYIMGVANYILLAFSALNNGLFGIAISYLLIYTPIQIVGFTAWRDNSDKRDRVKARKFKFWHAVVIVVACLAGSFCVGSLLTFLPGQQLAFADATSNVLNLCAEILMMLRFRESWILWLSNDIVDITMWSMVAMRGGNGLMVVIMTAIGLIMDVRGIINWSKATRRNRRNR